MVTAKEGGKRSSSSTSGSSGDAKGSAKIHLDETKTEHAIRERAYQLWEQSGRPHGRDIDFWLKARKEILGK
jgi:hypothetical protein